jgi:hypothetical protein
VRVSEGDSWRAEVLPSGTHSYIVARAGQVPGRPMRFAVSAVDRNGNESGRALGTLK